MNERWVASRFNAQRTVEGNLVLYNSMTGAVLSVPPGSLQQAARAALRHGVEGEPAGVATDLVSAGMLVRAGVDEFRRARVVREVEGNAADRLHLIVMPTEQCNFRCVYCYETFLKGEMKQPIREGLMRYVDQRVRRVKSMAVEWFGGEPLAAPNTIRELSRSFMASCNKYDVPYVASMTTNGSLLTPELIPEVLSWQVRTLQITLDGPARTHDRQRKLMGGGGTFDRIFHNLKALAATDAEFMVLLRINYTDEVLEAVPELLDLLGQHFGGDQRFGVLPRPVSNLGGPLKGSFETCEAGHQFEIIEQAMRRGMRSGSLLERVLQPHGSVCYAAKPNSFVIGSDGTVYKCTVALSDERNHVGRLLPDGQMELNMDRFALWVTNDEQVDQGCQTCFFRPACQGNACPLERMNKGEAPCPTWKTQIGDTLRVIALESDLLAAPAGTVLTAATGD